MQKTGEATFVTWINLKIGMLQRRGLISFRMSRKYAMTEIPLCSRESSTLCFSHCLGGYTFPVPPSPTLHPSKPSILVEMSLPTWYRLSQHHISFLQDFFFFFNYTFNKMIHSIATEHILWCQTLF